MISALTYDAIRKRFCPHCRVYFATRGVPCLEHTLPEERAARARAIGVTR